MPAGYDRNPSNYITFCDIFRNRLTFFQLVVEAQTLGPLKDNMKYDTINIPWCCMVFSSIVDFLKCAKLKLVAGGSRQKPHGVPHSRHPVVAHGF